MSQPMNRACKLPELGEVDREAGEFWVANPFMMPEQGKNLSAYERNKLYLNVGGTSFLDASFASNADLPSDSRSAIAADFDLDGDPDLLVCSVGGGPLRLFANELPPANRVRIQLQGESSNQQAIGSRIVAEADGQTIVRDWFMSNGFQGQSPVPSLIGIGQASQIDRLTVRWPDGSQQTFEDLPAGSDVVITQGKSGWKTSSP